MVCEEQCRPRAHVLRNGIFSFELCFSLENNPLQLQGCSSRREHLPCLSEALSLSSTGGKRKKKKTEVTPSLQVHEMHV